MRLLEVLPNGGFRLTKNLDNAIPPYAILSHRWEDDSQEVTFEDMDKGSGRGKAGYQRVYPGRIRGQLGLKEGANDGRPPVRWIRR